MSEQVFCSRASALPQLVYLNMYIYKQTITGLKDKKKIYFKDLKIERKKDNKIKR